MRKITKEAVNAFMNAEKFNGSNTRVEIWNWDKSKAVLMYLHGNLIAQRFLSTGVIQITNCGWFSNTTKERLNGIPNVNIVQRKGIWYLNGVEWDGNLIDIN